jgi:hypothetical protein
MRVSQKFVRINWKKNSCKVYFSIIYSKFQENIQIKNFNSGNFLEKYHNLFQKAKI